MRVGTGARRPRVKLQLWDTAGTERFRSVSRSYYRGAAGAILVYDVASRASFHNLPTFLNDARALAGPDLTLLLAGNKTDLDGPEAAAAAAGGNLLDDEDPLPSPASSRVTTTTAGGTADGSAPSSLRSNPPPPAPAPGAATGSRIGTRLTATVAPQGREVAAAEAARWASASGVPVAVEVSALDGTGVDALFERLARTILAKIELGEIDPDDPASGIQYGDVAWGEMDGGSVRSGLSGGDGGVRRRGRRRAGTGGWGGMREWEAVFRLDRRKRSGCC